MIVEELFSEIEGRLAESEVLDQQQQPAPQRRSSRPKGKTWVTKKGVRRPNCMRLAYIIRRFVYPEARFKFVSVKDYPVRRARSACSKFTHIGDKCSFEVLLLLDRNDPTLRAIGEVMHDIDFKDGKFGREQARHRACDCRDLLTKRGSRPHRARFSAF
jgi:hypothetical protein